MTGVSTLAQRTIDKASDAIFWVDEEGRVLYANDKAMETLGYSREELVSLTAFDVDRILDRELWPVALEEIAKRGWILTETRYRTRSGDEIPVEVVAHGLEHEGRKIICVNARDVRRRKHTEHELRRSERRYRTLAAVSPVGIFHTDPEGNCLYVNRRWCEIAGIDAQTAAGPGWAQALHPEDRDRVFAEWRAAAESSQPFQGEYRFLHDDGSVRWVIGQALAEVGEQGKTHGFVGTVTDVTELRHGERRLKALVEGTAGTTGNAFFRSLVRHLAEALEVRYSLIGQLQGHRQVAVRAMWDGERFHEGVTYDLAGTPCDGVLTNETECWFGDRIQDRFPEDTMLIDLGAESYHGVPLFGTDGRGLGLLVVLDVEPMVEDPGTQRLLAVFASRAAAELERSMLEVERRQLEAQVQHTQKLESLGVLAGGIAHDFNNLLGGILGNAELALGRLDEDNPARPLLEEISRAAERSAELSNQMLAYSGKGKFVVQPFDLGEMVREMASLLQRAISKKAMLVFELAEDLPLVEGDVTQIRQVVMNLITNGSDALEDEPGTITLRTRAIEVAEGELRTDDAGLVLAPGDYVALEVTDTGCGMSEATRRRIFEPFFTTKFTGRGLGMSAVLGIVRGHRGAIEVTSEPGAGSMFRFMMPVCEGREFAAAGADSETPITWQESETEEGIILVVDDEEIVRLLARSILEDAGFQVLECHDGQQAIECYQRHRDEIAAVLLDLTMPVLDGIETFEILREMSPSLRIVFSSGYSEQVALARLSQCGPVGFVQKPYRPHNLLAKVREVLEL